MKIATETFIADLEEIAKTRIQLANYLREMATTITKAETTGESRSGPLGLEREREDIQQLSQNLSQGVFRLLVLGDMKRGKSTFLNALIGANVLPSAVNPCTALLTILRYGEEQKVSVHFNDGTAPESMDLKTFKTRYTIDPAEAKRLEREKKLAFPNVQYAAMEYPLPLLKQGIEIVDSPGLNDTEARNQLSLGYIKNCHAVLFVLRATQPCTLGERRYLENYLKDKGLTIFFLLNAWDRVQDSLLDPEDPEELAEAEEKLHRVFAANLNEYCEVDGVNIYNQRVFAISALQALRKQLKNPTADLSGTGFPEFMAALDHFLTRERAKAEFSPAQTMARQTETRVKEAIARRIPLLDKDLEALKAQILAVEPEFEKLGEICDRFITEIRTMGDGKATAIADSFRDYLLNLEHSFEADFGDRVNLEFFALVSKKKREAFEAQMGQAFEEYLKDKIAAWSNTVEAEMNTVVAQLSAKAAKYGSEYAQVTAKITAQLTGEENNSKEDNTPAWANWATGLISTGTGNLSEGILQGTGFDVKDMVVNMMLVLGIGAFTTALFGALAGPLTLVFLGFGVGTWQMEKARQELLQTAKKELGKHLPQVAQEQRPIIYEAIASSFKAYEQEVTQRVRDDLKGRKAELENLVQQKETSKINRDAELARLQQLETDMRELCSKIEAINNEQ